jgi:hypothetical protein
MLVGSLRSVGHKTAAYDPEAVGFGCGQLSGLASMMMNRGPADALPLTIRPPFAESARADRIVEAAGMA